jgi:hypothetical protein
MVVLFQLDSHLDTICVVYLYVYQLVVLHLLYVSLCFVYLQFVVLYCRDHYVSYTGDKKRWFSVRWTSFIV